MKFALSPLSPSSALNSLVLAGLLATAGASAMAQAPATPPAAPTAASGPADRMSHHDPAKMQAMMAKHQAELKAKLKITATQESAWTTYTTAMRPPAHMARPSTEERAAFDKLTTPERIDKMRALRTQRMTEMGAAMDQRGEATKTFYATLSPEQQKVSDAEHKKHGWPSKTGAQHGRAAK